MNTLAHKGGEDRGARNADRPSRTESGSRSTLQLNEARPLTATQAQWHERLNQSPQVESQLQIQRSLDRSPRVMAQTTLAQTLAERTGAFQPQPAIQRQAMSEDEELKSDTSLPLQRQENRTGMPDTLKAGVEALSGIAMDDVRVEYNSAEPASVNALATTQAKQIKLAPGQEQHLSHEVWHVVQQEQGRVRPTTEVNGVAVNDDSALEREADTMGARASQLGSSGAGVTGESGPKPSSHSSPSSPVQRAALTDTGSEDVVTPAQAIKAALGGLAVNAMLLPGSQPAGEAERAKSVEATVKKSTLRKDERKKSANLTKVTTMARAEQVILQGADVKKFYDAGHLVADQLIGKTDDSFVLWNLAPQVAALNAPTYAQIMEEEVKAAAAKADVKLKVKVSYPGDGNYKVKVKDLVKRGIVKAEPVDQANVKIKGKKQPLEKEITIPRRVPNEWKMTATVSHKTEKLRKIEKSTAQGELAEHYVPDISTASAPTIGSPFRFTVSDATLNQPTSKLTVGSAQERKFKARQWGPSATGVVTEDVISLVSSVFRDLESGKLILDMLKGTDLLVPKTQQQVIFDSINEATKPLSQLVELSTRITKASEDRNLLTLGLLELSSRLFKMNEEADESNKIKVLAISDKIGKIQLGAFPLSVPLKELNEGIIKLNEEYLPKVKEHTAAAQKEETVSGAMNHLINMKAAADDILEELDPLTEGLKEVDEKIKALTEELNGVREESQRLQEEITRAKELQKSVVTVPTPKQDEPVTASTLLSTGSLSVSLLQSVPQQVQSSSAQSPVFDFTPKSEKSKSSRLKRKHETEEDEEESVKALKTEVPYDMTSVPYSSKEWSGGGMLQFFWFGGSPVRASQTMLLKNNEVVTATDVRFDNGLVSVTYSEGI